MLIIIASGGMEKKDWSLFTGSYFLGILAALPMLVAVYYVKHYWLEHAASIRRIIFFAFALIGFLSEFSKFLILRYKYITNTALTKPFDGILYGVMISLGYSTLANVFFFYEWDYTSQISIVLYTLPVANLLTGIVLGFFVGMGKFRKPSFIDSITGLGAAIFFLGFYNFCLFSEDYLLLGLVAAGTLIITVTLSIKSLNTDMKSMM
ncbi:MAG: PrsW family intramembrane metalloprotease [Bacteroidales bacterium]|nr:PrsW family intramembrane metalloprotease [Bacteroidales bacterium]